MLLLVLFSWPTTSRPSPSTCTLPATRWVPLWCLPSPRNCRFRDAHTGCGRAHDRSFYAAACSADFGFSAFLPLDFLLRRGCNLAPLRARVSCVPCPGVARRVHPALAPVQLGRARPHVWAPCGPWCLVPLSYLTSPLAQSGLLCVLRPGVCFLLASPDLCFPVLGHGDAPMPHALEL